jgi:hypothetical protein
LNAKQCNINVSDGLYNGAVGKLCQIGVNTKNIPIVAWLQYDDPHIGEEARNVVKFGPNDSKSKNDLF